MALSTSPAGIELIKKHEGLRLSWYICPAGKPTIGYGHVIKAGEQHLKNGAISAAEAEEILKRDLAHFEAGVRRLVKVPVGQGEFDALVSFAFNLGLGSLGTSTLLRLLNSGDRAGAANQFQRWVYATVDGEKRKLPGLLRRRVDEAELFRAGGPVAGDQE